MNELYDFLTQKIIGNNKICKNMNNLAVLISGVMYDRGEIEKEARKKKERSIASFLHQIDSYNRSCSEKLRVLIRDALNKRLNDLEVPESTAENVMRKFESIIDSINKKTRLKLKSEAPEAELRELLEWANKATSHFIITNKTAEVLTDNIEIKDDINDIQEVLIRRMGLFINCDGDEEERWFYSSRRR